MIYIIIILVIQIQQFEYLGMQRQKQKIGTQIYIMFHMLVQIVSSKEGEVVVMVLKQEYLQVEITMEMLIKVILSV